MPRSLGFAEGSGEMSAERPRRSEPLGRAEERPARAPRPRPEGACAKARDTSAETSTTRRTRGLCEVSRGRPGRAAARRYDLPLFANAKVKAPGPRVVLSAAKNNLGRRQGARRARKPEALGRGRQIEPAGRAVRAGASARAAEGVRGTRQVERRPPRVECFRGLRRGWPRKSGVLPSLRRTARAAGRWEGSASVGFPPPFSGFSRGHP